MNHEDSIDPFEAFEALEICTGTILHAEEFPAARKPAYKLRIDLGQYGVKTSSAQLTGRYSPESLVGRQIIAVMNLGTRMIAGFPSEVLVCGFADSSGDVVLAVPDAPVSNGSRLF